MNINPEAPLIGKKEIIINAPVEKVWAILSEINNWPKWQKEISFAKLEGPLEKGTPFQWKAMGVNITSQLQEVVPYQIIGWSGKSIGMNAIHIWKFEKLDNKTKVLTEESLSGWLAKLIKLLKPDFLEQSLSKAINRLKNQAETKN